ncbi:hypothetical protein MACJ_000884 [Theileria orientalis]|uniref:Uncharacterized protein n=1 Tax=Theileria orientalis TaxID=68886 RepID=A0A976QUZ0_THEOR|nr:hypothetical protein MACJ_000884 [Theileria orientalis]
MKPEIFENLSTQPIEEPALMRRMSASSEGVKNTQPEISKNDLMETYRSVSEVPKKKKSPRIWNIFDWSFKNVSYDRMSPENKKWLVIYKVMSYVAIGLLIIAYTFFIALLFSYLIHIEQGEIVDEDLFVPVSESLLHSLSTLWKQEAYFVVMVVFIFSISLPFIKMIATILAYIITARHRKKQINLFFGKRGNKLMKSKMSKGFSASEEEGNFSGESEMSDYSIYEDGRLIKYAREVLLILKLISKFQMVDVIILLVNIAFLRSAFSWAMPGRGLLYLVVYCLTSILGTQLLNLAVEGEREIFEYWRAVRLLCLPVLSNYYSSCLASHADGEDEFRMSNIKDVGSDHLTESEVNRAVEYEMNSGLESFSKNRMERRASMMNLVGKNGQLDVMSDCTSEADFYDILYSSKKKDIKVRWYRCDIFVTILVLINLVSAALILTNEKLFGVAFTADPTKKMGMDGHQMSFFEIMLALRDCWYYLPFFVFFFLSVVVPMLFHLLFLAGLFLYNFAISNKDCNSISNFDPGKPLIKPAHCLNTNVKVTKFIFNTCNLLSEWSLGEVLALGMTAAFVSLKTAYCVRFYLPPKKICCVFTLISTFGITSFLLNIQFFMWHTRILNRLSDVTMYIESINSSKTESDTSYEGKTHLEAIEGTVPRLKVSVSGNSQNLKRLESYIEGGNNEIMYEPDRGDEEKKKKTRIKRMMFKFIDIIRHVVYSKFIISIFFGIFFFVSVYLFVFSFVTTTPPAVVSEAKVQEFLDTGVPGIFKVIKKNLPSTYGDCLNELAPPKPCIGDNPAFVYESGYRLEVTWVTGINTIQLLESNFKVRDDNRIELKLHLLFKSIRPNIRLSLPSQNVDLFSGDNLCCGDDIHVVVVMSSEYADRSPYLRDVVLENFQISNLKLLGIVSQVIEKIVDLTDFLEYRIVYYGNEYLKKQERVLRWRGLYFSPLEYFNFLLDLNYPEGLIFPKKDAPSK